MDAKDRQHQSSETTQDSEPRPEQDPTSGAKERRETEPCPLSPPKDVVTAKDLCWTDASGLRRRAPRPRFVRAAALDDAERQGQEFLAFASLEVARRYPGSCLILQGDYGGEVYATCPVSEVRCPEARVEELLAAFGVASCDLEESLSLHFEALRPGSHVSGGQGGGSVTEGLWLRSDYDVPDLRAQVEAALFHNRAVDVEPFRAWHRRWLAARPPRPPEPDRLRFRFVDPPVPREDSAALEVLVGPLERTFRASLGYWQRADYRDHWRQQLRRIVQGETFAGLLSNAPAPAKRKRNLLWELRRDGDAVLVRARGLEEADLPKGLSYGQIHELVSLSPGDVGGDRIYRLSLGAIERFLRDLEAKLRDPS